ncbi:hypothetical protein D3C80_1804100 [compost metagenome]
MACAIGISFGASCQTIWDTSVSQASVFCAATRRSLELRQDTASGEQLIGLAVQQVKVAQHVALEQFEQDQFDLGAYSQAAPGVEKVPTQGFRPQRITRLIQCLIK